MLVALHPAKFNSILIFRFNTQPPKSQNKLPGYWKGILICTLGKMHLRHLN